MGRVERCEYYPGGLLKATHFWDGTSEKLEYDKNGNVITYETDEGIISHYIHDSLNRVTQISVEGGGVKRCSYDEVGNVASVTDELGNTTKYEYTLTGQLEKVIDSLGNETHYRYDELDQLIEVRQNGKLEEVSTDRITTYEYNLLGQIKSITDALGQKEHYRYNKVGQLIEKMDKDGYLTKYGYTGQGDVNYVQYGDGREVFMSYNPLRQLIEVKDWLGVTDIKVDPLGQVTQVSDHNNKVVSYTYGKIGERRSITYPDGKIVKYEYDKHLRLTKVNDGNQAITYHYDELGDFTEKRFGNNARAQYGYNELGQLTNLAHYYGDKLVDSFQYEYDLAGNKTQVKRLREGLENENGTFYYKYDPLNRLEQFGKIGQPFTRAYQYDSFGNRTRKMEEGGNTNYTYNPLNQLISSKCEKGSEQSYQYDKRGNLRSIYQNSKLTHQYEFGSLNRLEKTYNYEKSIGTSYAYNGLDKRVSSTHLVPFGVVTPSQKLGEMHLNPTKQIEDVLDLTRDYHNLLQRNESDFKPTSTNFNQKTTSSTNFAYDFGVITAQSERGISQNYLLDDLGSPLRVIGGLIDESYHYDEFGMPLIAENQRMDASPSKQPFGFTGYRMDEFDVTGMLFAQAREYNPSIGRFISQDTHWNLANMIYGDHDDYEDYEIVAGPNLFAIRQSSNLYEYGLSNPFAYVDLDGECLGIITTGLKKAGTYIKNVAAPAIKNTVTNTIVPAVKNTVTNVIVPAARNTVKKAWKAIRLPTAVGTIYGAYSGVRGGLESLAGGKGFWEGFWPSATVGFLQGFTLTYLYKKNMLRLGHYFLSGFIGDGLKQVLKGTSIEDLNGWSMLLSGGFALLGGKLSNMLFNGAEIGKIAQTLAGIPLINAFLDFLRFSIDAFMYSGQCES